MASDIPDTDTGSARERPEITAFWAWWRDMSPNLEQDYVTAGMVSRDHVESVIEQLSRVSAGLAWELGCPGPGAYQLVVTADGDDLLFAPAARLIAAAPSDSVWRFFSSRPPRPVDSETNVVLGGRRFNLSEARFSLNARADEELVDIKFDHPETRGLPSEQVYTVAFLILDSLLGEDAVERHVGMIDVGRIRFGAKDYRSLLTEVARMTELRSERLAQGIEHFAFLDTERDGLPGVTTVMTGRAHREYPTFDTRAEVRIALQHPTPNGLVGHDEAATLNNLQEALERKVAENAVVTSRDTHAGYRVLNFALDGDGSVGAWFQRLPDELEPAVSVEVRLHPDAGWEHARSLVESANGGRPR